MAVYRHIQIEYWQDGFVLDLTPEEKYFYLYLMTNSKTSQCGIYELPKRIIETETGYNRETVEKLLRRFEEYEKIVYCEETKEIYLKNWIKHNRAVSPKVKRCVEKEISKIKSEMLVDLFFKQCDKYGYTLNKPVEKINTTIDTVSIPIPTVENNSKYHYGEKEKEKQKEKQKEKEKEKQKQKQCDDTIGNDKFEKSIGRYKKLYEQNVGLINPIVAEWLFEVYETIDYELFKKAIEIATNRGRCNKGYINGILKQWRDNNIKSIEDLNAYEVGIKNRGDNYGAYKYEHSKFKHANTCEEEDEELYRKPTEEELEAVRREFGEFEPR